ncbi:MAG: NUDIX domain-containing protein [Defluviitaleaceae bacterium]|nr:NUDIX domain-containing protein [Defluviitaleaceae bacterium]MCL2276032.1 NUDIX domain-containing protein [Defluviitaleaceae bacterium]
MREQARCIILRGTQILFVNQMVNGQLRQVFIGGGIEENETPTQAVLRELQEEAHVQGEIIFGPAIIQTATAKEYIFLVSIPENTQPILGNDPELPPDKQDMQGLLWRDAIAEVEQFNKYDRQYFQAMLDTGRKSGVHAPWANVLESIITYNAN